MEAKAGRAAETGAHAEAGTVSARNETMGNFMVDVVTASGLQK